MIEEEAARLGADGGGRGLRAAEDEGDAVVAVRDGYREEEWLVAAARAAGEGCGDGAEIEAEGRCAGGRGFVQRGGCELMERRVRLCGGALEAPGLRSGGGADGKAEDRKGDADCIARGVHR